jgi:hypothetical protein
MVENSCSIPLQNLLAAANLSELPNLSGWDAMLLYECMQMSYTQEHMLYTGTMVPWHVKCSELCPTLCD